MNNKKMQKIIYIGADHTGYDLKLKLKKWLEGLGCYKVFDLGGNSANNSDDYPDFGFAVGKAVQKESKSIGILLCGTGVGICIAANKVPGIRAALVYEPKLTSLAVEHDNANILCLASRFTSYQKMQKIIDIFLNSKFQGGRHLRRINKIKAFERKELNKNEIN